MILIQALVLLVFCLSFSTEMVCRAAETSTNSNPHLNIERLFGGEEFSVSSFGGIVWAQNGRGYYKMEKADEPRKGQDLVFFDCATTNKEIVVPAHAFTIPGSWSLLSVESFELSRDESQMLIYSNSKRVWRQNTRGDYWLLDITGRDLRKLGGDAPPSSLLFARFSPDGSKVAYVRENNLYVENVLDGAITQVTRDGSRTIINGTSDWVYEEELLLREAYRWSPDSSSIAYWQFNTAGTREFTLLNNTEGLYPTELRFSYPKTGQQNSSVRVGVIPAQGGDTRWLDIPGDARNHYLAEMFWSSNSTELLVQQLNRKQNENVFYLSDSSNGRARRLFVERDDAWVEFENDAQWVGASEALIWLSERDGWRHLYKVQQRSTSDATALIQGNFDVLKVAATDAKQNRVYFYASPTNAAQRYLFSVQMDGKEMKQVTPQDQPGTHHYNVAPGGLYAIHTYSTANQPPITELIELPSHKSLRMLEENKKLNEKLAALHRPSMEFLRLEIGSDIELDAYIIKPPEFDPNLKYPLLVHVYGEPHGQTVRDAWLGSTHLWHWMLAQQGYVIASIDNRGVLSPRGRDFRKGVYRQVGIQASSDQAEGVRALLKRFSFLDPERVGVWGWSGGGSMTLNAILRFSELYKTAIAIASVPNQRLYDTIYQERYMGLPSENAEGYRKGSPLNYASQLKGNLLIIHGTGDDNVHYQGMEAMVNELIAYNKQFSMMVYPNRSHSISEGQNTMRHLFTLMTDYLEKYLLKPSASKMPKPTKTEDKDKTSSSN